MQKYLQPDNQLSFMLHELVFLGAIRSSHHILQLASHLYSCKILQPYVASTIRMHSDAVLSSTGALLMKTVITNNRQQQMVHFRFGWIRLQDTCESASLSASQAASQGRVGRIKKENK